MIYLLCALLGLMLIFRGHRIGALAGLLHGWWIAPVGVLAPLIALAVVLLAPQMPDMFAGMTDGPQDAGWWRLGNALGFASGVLGLASWYWTRSGLNAEAHGDDRGAPYDPALPATVTQPLSPFWSAFQEGYRQAPRWAALPAALLAGSPPLLALLHPELARSPHAIATAVSLTIFALTVLPFTIYRRTGMVAALIPLLLWIILLLTAPDGGLPWWIGLVTTTALLVLAILGVRRRWVPTNIAAWVWRFRPIGLVAGAPLGWPVGVLVLVAALVVCLATELWPSVVSAVAHAPPVAMIALALVVGPFALALAALRAVAPPYGSWAAAPGGVTAKRVLGVALILWVVFLTPSWLQPSGLYEIRAVEAPNLAGSPSERPDLQKALADWRQQQFDCGHPKDQALPVVIAAAEGGASRAALWFLSAAELLDGRTDRRFGRYLFAISGVSGGSLGAATYLEALAADRADGGNRCFGPRLPTMSRGFDAMVSADPLAPALAGYFLDDALMRLLPLRVVWPDVKDRAGLLESAFEQSWLDWWPVAQSAPARAAATGGLIDLRNRRLAEPAPHLLLNGTEVDTGRRLITSTIRFTAKDDLFPAAEDLLALINRDVPVATAVTNSARFPLISPAGRADGRQVIDGGYFDNYGSRTADDLVLAIRRIAAAQHWRLEPIVVVVSDDAEFAPADLPRFTISCTQPFPALPAGDKTPASEAEPIAPVLGLVATRGAHADDGLYILRYRLCPAQRMVHIALPKPDPARNETAPMNWVLNQAAGSFMRQTAPKDPFNLAQADLLGRIFDQLRDAAE
jgi:hypothetical protein